MSTLYTIDFEFLEGGSPHGGFITPISIGLVCENGNEYYAEHATFDWEMAEHQNPWLLENVKPHLKGGEFLKHPSQIKEDLGKFFAANSRLGVSRTDPEFWGYYADYDWVTFCWHFGRMIDLPKSFPKYCMDIKQWMDEHEFTRDDLPAQDGVVHNSLDDARWMMQVVKTIIK